MGTTFHLALRYKKRLFTLFHLNQICTVSIATPTLHSSNCYTDRKRLTLWSVRLWIFQNQYQNNYPSSYCQAASDKGWCRLFVLFCEKYPAQVCGLLTHMSKRSKESLVFLNLWPGWCISGKKCFSIESLQC